MSIVLKLSFYTLMYFNIKFKYFPLLSDTRAYSNNTLYVIVNTWERDIAGLQEEKKG